MNFFVTLSKSRQLTGISRNPQEKFVAISVAISWQFFEDGLETWHFRGKNRKKLREKVAVK
jgi:hypothetical protein